MKNFEYAAPRTESDVVSLLGANWDDSEILAGGTDLVGLMKTMVVTPGRVVNIKNVDSMRGIQAVSGGVTIGAVTTLDELAESRQLDGYPALKQAIAGIDSAMLQAQGTIGGELCQRPRCWYFRNGHGLLASSGEMVTRGENRYHAILGNAGPAKFVAASRVAPALIALEARVRLAGPEIDEETLLPLEAFYQVPRSEAHRETVLRPNQVLTHVLLPPADGIVSATYEVRHGAGPDFPLAAAAAALRIEGGIIRSARIVLGHVAPIPWFSPEASAVIIGRRVDLQSAEDAGGAAVAAATPLSDNGYKVQLAATAVKRAILQAAGLNTGGF